MFDKKWWAKWGWLLTTPQILTIILVSLLVVKRPEMFCGIWDYSVNIFFLEIFPLLAYPIAHMEQQELYCWQEVSWDGNGR